MKNTNKQRKHMNIKKTPKRQKYLWKMQEKTEKNNNKQRKRKNNKKTQKKTKRL